MGIPTYEYIGNTIFTVLEMDKVIELSGQGFEISVLDENSYRKIYVFTDENLFSHTDGIDILYSNKDFVLADITNRGTDYFFLQRIPHRIMNRNPIPKRFWDNLLRTAVYMNNISWDPYVHSIVDQVNTDSITSYIQKLPDFRTRLRRNSFCRGNTAPSDNPIGRSPVRDA